MEGPLFQVKITGEKLKSFSSILHLLAKIGKDLLLELEKGSITFRSLNDSKSAFSAVEFESDYFEDFSSSVETFSCKINLKAVCSIMKNLKNVTSLSLSAQVSEGEYEVIFVLAISHGIKRTHRIGYGDCEVMTALFDDDNASCLRSEPRVFTQLLEHIHQSSEIAIETGLDMFKVRSFHRQEADSTSDHITKRVMTTGVSVDTNEFDLFNYRADHGEGETQLIFCMKEFKAFLGFCEAIDARDFTLFYSMEARPIKLTCSSSRNFSASLIVATLVEPRFAEASVGRNMQSKRTGISDDTAAPLSERKLQRRLSEMSGDET